MMLRSLAIEVLVPLQVVLWLRCRQFQKEAAYFEKDNFAAEIDGRVLLRLGEHQLASLGLRRCLQTCRRIVNVLPLQLFEYFLSFLPHLT